MYYYYNYYHDTVSDAVSRARPLSRVPGLGVMDGQSIYRGSKTKIVDFPTNRCTETSRISISSENIFIERLHDQYTYVVFIYKVKNTIGSPDM